MLKTSLYLVLITSSEKREGLHETLQADLLTKYSWLAHEVVQAFTCSSSFWSELSCAHILPCCQLLVGSHSTVSSACQFLLLLYLSYTCLFHIIPAGRFFSLTLVYLKYPRRSVPTSQFFILLYLKLCKQIHWQNTTGSHAEIYKASSCSWFFLIQAE